MTLLPTPTALYGGGTAEAHLARKNKDGSNRTSVTDLGMVVEQLLPTGDPTAPPSDDGNTPSDDPHQPPPPTASSPPSSSNG